MKRLKFKFRRNSNGTFGANIVPGETLGRRELTDLLAAASHLIPTSAAVAAMIHLPEVIVAEVTDGNRVYIEGLGTFKLTVKTRAVTSTEVFRTNRDVVEYDIAFQIDRQLKDALKKMVKIQCR
jgi:nucleoid DNA-binding protein